MNHVMTLEGQRREGAAVSGDTARGRARVRTVALPTEHGGWSITLEPLALGLLIAPSTAGFLLALATLCAFLARQPFKIAVADRRRGRRFPRTPVAEKFFLLYGGIALASALAAAATADGGAFLLPLLLAAPLASVQLVYDAAGRSRALAPELAGSTGLAAVAAAIALAGGWPLPAALVLWLLLTLRAAPTILYVRARLCLLHGETARKAPALLSHVAALGLACLLALKGDAPLLAALALVVLLLRAAVGLSSPAGEGNAKRVGVGEIVYGAIYVLAVAAGYLFS